MTRYFVCLAVPLLWIPLVGAQPTDTTYQQAHRPQYHVSARQHWIGNPNGLVYFDGEYHLFYQHNPVGIREEHRGWGHAVSRDLVHWKDLPVALAEDPGPNGEPTLVLSGSCVVDRQNTSGFGTGSRPPMVALYTAQPAGRPQRQHVAYSLDRGRTWTKWTGNPVIDLQKKDFRDPKVFWHEPSARWVMVVALPTERKALFYASADLKRWERTGEFTAPTPGPVAWACPDLLELPVEASRERRWVLLLSVSGGAPAGGSGTQYYVGDFDGRTFRATQPDARPVDWGKDYYAATTFNHLPPGRSPLSIGWMTNLQYANDLPTTPFGGAMTLPRELRLVRSGNTHELRQRPATQLNQLLGERFSWSGTSLSDLNHQLRAGNIGGDAYVLTVEADPARPLSVNVRKGGPDETLVGYDPARQQVFIDRSRSGQVAFRKEFPGRSAAPLRSANTAPATTSATPAPATTSVATGATAAVARSGAGPLSTTLPEPTGRPTTAPPAGLLRLDIWVDRSSVEVFVNDGQATLTNLIFPSPASQGLEFAGDGIRRVTLRWLDSIWP